MAINFPDSPSSGDTFTDSTSGFTYEWNGTVWRSFDPSTAANIRELDDISSGFNGSLKAFNLTIDSSAIEPANAQQLIIAVNGSLMNPVNDYTISGSVITFTTAPTGGHAFVGTLLGSALSLNTIADNTVGPTALTTTSNFRMNGLTLDQGAGIITAFGFQGGSITADLDSTFSANVSIAGSLTVQGTQTIINTDELNVQDKTIGIGSTNAPTSTTQDDAGVIIYGQTHVNILYDRDKAAVGINTGLSVAGFVTATQVDAGTRLVATAATVGSGVTINNTGIDAGIGAGIVTASSFVGGGANITALSGSNIASGTVAAARVATLNQDTTGNADTATTATNVTVADESTDTTCSVLYITGATGTQAPKSGSNLQFNSSSGLLSASGFTGDGSSISDINASNITSGTLAAARVATLNQNTTGTSAGLTGTPDIDCGTGSFTGDVDVAQKIVHTGDTDTFLSFGTNSIALNAAGVLAAQIVSTGRIGINTDNPQKELDVFGVTAPSIRVSNPTKSADFICNGTGGLIRTVGAYPLILSTDQTERLQIDSSGGFKFSNGLFDEKCNITAGKLSDNQNIDLDNGMVHYFSTQESTTATPNIRINGSNTLQAAMDTGDVCSVTLITTAAAAGYSANLTIDGNAVTEEWVGGAAPAAGSADGLDIYTYTIICIGTGTGDSGFKVIANLTNATN